MLCIFIIAIIYVISVSAGTPFVDKGNRPDFFEKVDNEVISININMSDEEFALLKTQADYNCNRAGTPTLNISQSLQQYQFIAKSFLQLIQMMNFTETYPGYDFSQLLPELNIDKNGYAKLDTAEILQGFDTDFEHYRLRDYANIPIIFQFFMSNTKFSIIKVAITLSQLKVADNVQLNPQLQQILALANTTTKYNEFKTKDAVMTTKVGGKTTVYKKITFSLGGQSSLCFSKPGYNIKIRGGKSLYGSNQFKLRAESADPSFMRSKLATDVYNRLGLKCIATSYATVTINDEYMGLFTISDAYKDSWIESEYKVANTTSLYQCNTLAFLTLKNAAFLCENTNENVSNTNEYAQLLMTLDKAQSAADIEDIFEVDSFLTQMALEYILGSWDRLLHIGHNYYMFKQPNGKWIYLSYDFDHEFGINMDRGIMGPITVDSPERIQKINFDYPNYSFNDWETNHIHIVDILIRKDPTRFNAILKDVVAKAFNPDVLYPRIDEIKALIQPYVEKDYTPVDGKLPGRINDIGDEFYNYDQWNANVEFTSVPTDQYFAYGIKYWILAKYRYLCKTYELECNAIYLDESYIYPVNKDVEFKGYDWKKYFPDFDMTPTVATTTTVTSEPTQTKSKSVLSGEKENKSSSNEITYKCLAELIGYSCCTEKQTTVYATDDNGEWGYDFQKGEWCGITPFESHKQKEQCWSEFFGYPCCLGCTVREEDENGAWGYEFEQWCGIQSYCQK